MKARSFLWAVLPVAAALILTACSSSDDNFDNKQADQPNAGNSCKIPVTIKVGTEAEDNATRATVDANNSTLRFQAGDKLYFSNADGSVYGTADVPAEATGKTDCTIETIVDFHEQPKDGEKLNVVLVGPDNKALTVSGDKVTGVNYGNAVVKDVATAVKQYSNIKGDGTYNKNTISVDLKQNTAFINFNVSYTNIYYTATAASEDIVVKNNNATIGSGKITTTVSRANNRSTVNAKFVVPVAKGTKMNNASVQVSTFDAIKLTSTATLEGKVYNSTKSAALPNPAVGNIVGRNGKIYASVNAAVNAGTTAVGVIVYLGTSTGDATYKNGLVLGLKDCKGITSRKYHWCNPENQGNSTKYTSDNAAVTTAQDGRATTWINNGARNSNSWPAYKAAMTNDITTTARLTKVVDQATKQSQIQTSQWFLPSLYQWNIIVKSGAKKNGTTNPNNLAQHEAGQGDAYYIGPTWSAFFNTTANSGVEQLEKDTGIYWSSTDATQTTGNSSKAWVFDARFGRVETNSKKRDDDVGNRVRPVFAF